MVITPSDYIDVLKGFTITDCAVRNRDCFTFSARNIEESAKASAISEQWVGKRYVAFYPNDESDRLLFTGFKTGYERIQVGASQYRENKSICIDSSGVVYSAGGGSEEDEAPIPKSKDGPLRGGVRRIRMIDGMLYVVGGAHSACRRRGPNDWESLCLDLPVPTRRDFDNVDIIENMGFNDIDGFAPDDLYTVAGRGVVWHCDGTHWHQIAFPSNMLLESVCCAGDGFVYIGAQSGALFRGRDKHWEMLERGNMSLPFKDIVWHAGRLWCTSDYGLWTLEEDQLVRVELPSDIAVCAGNLSAADGVMLMAGAHGAAFHDGDDWQLIFNAFKMEQALGL
ncbi:hypothetical protein J5J83_07670 [Azoarcus sp. L1K30]|uniref:WD40/YVTN/BNR-like repeat-containing protein n=1 Tax=Azoarcus sp. L1K30 TaxID=2820277 RepID=UPI001B83EC04|nr:hypothetical protein [Azoarcus sp. L1K30]MBR0565990.1 hypothetical protein [Azoarcus sp. L1K30]